MDAVIVGAGVIGSAIARELSGRGVRCTVLDDRAPGGGATQASAGMLAPYVEAHERGPLQDLGVRSLALYDDWIARVREESGVDVEYRRIGTLEVALDPAHAADLKRVAELNRDVGAEWLPDRTARVPLGTIAGALFTPSHGYVAAAQLTDALVAAARRHGSLFERARAASVARDGERLAVHSDRGTFAADRVVIAAGAWAGALYIEGTTAPPMRPVRGQLLQLGWRGDPIETIVWGPECYVVPRTDGTLLVGATAEEVGFDERATSAGVRDLLDAVCELLPEGWGASFLAVRVGLRPAAPDDLPILGPDPRLPGLLHASGHYRNGVLLAPVTAKLIADAIVEDTRDAAFEALSIERFRE